MILAIDLGGTHLRLAAGDGVGPWRETHQQRHPSPMRPDTFVQVVRKVLDSWGRGAAEFDAIGVSIAAVVDSNGSLRHAENLGWGGVPLSRLLSDAFDRPSIVDTDVFCGARFEMQLGAARHASSFLYVSIGTGVGHAIVLDRKLWRGASGAASAIGHVVLKTDGARCYCGKNGCLCTVASGQAQAVAEPPPNGLQFLAQAIGATATLVEPELVVLAGGAMNQPWFDFASLADLLPRFAYSGLVLPRIVASDAADPNLRGAALLARET